MESARFTAATLPSKTHTKKKKINIDINSSILVAMNTKIFDFVVIKVESPVLKNMEQKGFNLGFNLVVKCKIGLARLP